MPHLRSLHDDDYDNVSTIMAEVFPTKYTAEFQDAWRGRDRALSLGIVDSADMLMGFILTKATDPATRSIEFLGIHPSAQAGGLGTRLLRSVLADCERSNNRAILIPVNDPRVITWYTSHGFRTYGAPFISPYTGDLEQPMLWRPAAAC